jgi:uncharacterized SAM-binding protein YcdF (DUF218 family)
MIWIGTTAVFSGLLLRPLENAYSAPAKPEGDVIVVLGGGARGSGGVYSASERLSPGTLERVAAAYKLHRDTGLPLLLSAGAPFSDTSEAALAREYLLELGVQASKIITEEASRDTAENAAFSMKICRERGYKRIILLTSAFHMPRSVLLFEKAGAGELVPFPVARRTGGAGFLYGWLPGSSFEARQAFNEYAGLFYYRLYYVFFRGH